MSRGKPLRRKSHAKASEEGEYSRRSPFNTRGLGRRPRKHIRRMTNFGVHEGCLMRQRHRADVGWLGRVARNAQDERTGPAFEVIEAAVVEPAGENIHAVCINKRGMQEP